MNHIVTTETQTPPPSYAERRAAMADETRTRILDACVEILARGVAELSIPAVAREANVSVPTVYRNFPDKKTLVRETALYLRAKRGPTGVPEQLDDLPAAVRTQFLQTASATETVRAALASEPVLASYREQGAHEQRLGGNRRLLEDAIAHMSPADQDQVVLVTTVLCSSAALRAFREVAGASPEQAADAVTWAIGRLLGHTWPDASGSTTTTNQSRKKAKGNRR
jgi:AcrR family transcriptional regulator